MTVDSGPLTFAELRRLVALNKIVDPDFPADRAAAMLSLLDKDEKAGRPLPGWVELEDRARDRVEQA